MKLGVNNVTNKEYHDDRNFLSSSALKMIHKDPAEFYKKYKMGIKDEVRNQSALDFGTAAHLMLLEPPIFEQTVVQYDGVSRRGAAFEKFKSENEEKLILTRGDMMKLNDLKSAFLVNEPAVKLLQDCLFEHTMTGICSEVPVKARADAINLSGQYIVDVKTTAYDGGVESFKATLEGLYYDLSAALYCDIASQVYGKQFDFYYIVLSKSDMTCHVYRTSKSTYSMGYRRLDEAIKIYKNCLLTNVWSHEIVDSEVTDEIKEI